MALFRLPHALRSPNYFPDIPFARVPLEKIPLRQLQFQLFRTTGAVDLFSHISLRLASTSVFRKWTLYEQGHAIEPNKDHCIGFKYRPLLTEPDTLSRLPTYLTVGVDSVTLPCQLSYCFPFKKVTLVFRLASYRSSSEHLRSFYSEHAAQTDSLETLEHHYVHRHRLHLQSFIPAPSAYSATLVSLLDPTSHVRIRHPIKGRTCSHFQCLDAETVLRGDGSLLCPIHCGKSISPAASHTPPKNRRMIDHDELTA